MYLGPGHPEGQDAVHTLFESLTYGRFGKLSRKYESLAEQQGFSHQTYLRNVNLDRSNVC